MPESGIPQTCTHERRPGTTTCLYCLQEARARTGARRRRLLGRLALAVAGGGTAIAMVIAAVSALAPESGSVALIPDSPTVDQSGDVMPSGRSADAAAKAKAPPVLPVIDNGSRDLGDGIVATRSDAEVVVTFDTDLLRTRFDWKFEGVVRSTLPLVYGDVARHALDSVPAGRLVRGDLLEVLPERGISLAIPGTEGDTLMVWPLTRPGRDGPIVVAYRATSR